MRVLLVEDDIDLGEGIMRSFSRRDIRSEWVKSGGDAINFLADGHFDVVVLDLGLPDADGLDILEKIRAAGDGTPVLILTARTGPENQVAGFRTGADDYVTKPFDVKELVARLEAIDRRSKGRPDSVMVCAGVVLDTRTREVSYQEAPVDLSRREYELLKLLMERPGEVIERKDLENGLYGWADEVGSNTLEVHVHNLRKKLSKSLLETVRGVGYRLVADD